VRITLTTTGRQSGQPRPVELYAFPDGESLIVTGSRGGAARDPAWVLNLRAEPRARLRQGRRDRSVLAKEAQGRKRERLWRLVCAEFPLYERYQHKTARRFPVFVLEPNDDPAGRSADQRLPVDEADSPTRGGTPP
jgi:deazaflavin-dependent oxidoreductase (nitroreductase family)